MFDRIAALLRQRAGATAVEYALLAVLLAVVLFAVEKSIGSILGNFLANTGGSLRNMV